MIARVSAGGMTTADIVLVIGVTLAFGATWLLLWHRCFPEFRARLNTRGLFFLAGVPLVALRADSWRAAFGLLALILISGWISSRGRVERFFPRRWFYPTGQGRSWLSWIEIAAFFVLLAAGVLIGYRWAT